MINMTVPADSIGIEMHEWVKSNIASYHPVHSPVQSNVLHHPDDILISSSQAFEELPAHIIFKKILQCFKRTEE